MSQNWGFASEFCFKCQFLLDDMIPMGHICKHNKLFIPRLFATQSIPKSTLTNVLPPE